MGLRQTMKLYTEKKKKGGLKRWGRGHKGGITARLGYSNRELNEVLERYEKPGVCPNQSKRECHTKAEGAAMLNPYTVRKESSGEIQVTRMFETPLT